MRKNSASANARNMATIAIISGFMLPHKFLYSPIVAHVSDSGFLMHNKTIGVSGNRSLNACFESISACRNRSTRPSVLGRKQLYAVSEFQVPLIDCDLNHKAVTHESKTSE